MRRYLLSGVIICLFLLGSACQPKYKRVDLPEYQKTPDQELLLQANQKLIRESVRAIRERSKLNGWNLQETATGIFYQIFESPNSKSEKIVSGSGVSLVYNLSLLDGRRCYDSGSNGLKQFVVDRTNEISGLHDVIKYLHPGDSALLVIPSYHAYGLAGDGNRVPPAATLVFEIRVDSVRPPLQH